MFWLFRDSFYHPSINVDPSIFVIFGFKTFFFDNFENIFLAKSMFLYPGQILLYLALVYSKYPGFFPRLIFQYISCIHLLFILPQFHEL